MRIFQGGVRTPTKRIRRPEKKRRCSNGKTTIGVVVFSGFADACIVLYTEKDWADTRKSILEANLSLSSGKF